MKKKQLEMKKKILKAMLFCLSLITLLTSCREEDFANEANPSKATDSKIASKVSVGQYESEMPYNINVVYFIPSNMTARPEYERRVSEFMLAAQEFYRSNMYNWGYGNRSFGLLKNPSTKRIKINVIKGALPSSSYPYEQGGDRILAEVNAWFASHPNDKTSEHTIIFTAVPTPETETPYYGVGKICFVGDNEAWDYKYFNDNSPAGERAKWYMGGFMHELGHAMNLDHDALPKRQENLPGYGTSLMGLGNGTYGYTSTILTKACAATLSSCQLFSTTSKPTGYFYKNDGNFWVTGIKSSYANGRITITGSYKSDTPISNLLAHFSPGNEYEGPSGLATFTSNTFSMYIDVADLYYTNKDYQFFLYASYPDGSIIKSQEYTFSFKDNIPDTRLQSNRYNWTVSTSSQYAAYPASLAIDGNINTYWHTNYNPGSVQTNPIAGQAQVFPFYYEIDMDETKSIAGLSFIPLQNLVRSPNNITVWTRKTTSEEWKYQDNYNLTNVKDKQYVPFPQRENCRYIRISFGSSHDSKPYIAVAEIASYE